MIKPSQTDRVREYARTKYVEPARRRGDSIVEIISGDVVRGLHLMNLTPLVCQALKSNKFLDSNELKIEKIDGPPSGLGNNVKFTYRLGAAPESDKERGDSAFLRARGVAKDVFQSFGGGEAYLRAEREAWGPEDDL